MSFKKDYETNWEKIQKISSVKHIKINEMGQELLVSPDYPPRFHETYDLDSKYLSKDNFKGTILNKDGSLPNKNVRNKYYPPSGTSKGGHIAKTPLHAIRWAILNLTKEGDTVLDPFAGSGTTGAEAMFNNRKTIGIEYEFHKLTLETFKSISPDGEGDKWQLYEGDSSIHLDSIQDESVHLVNFSNPYPDGGDETSSIGKKSFYKKEGNAGKMKSTRTYWDLMKLIQDKSCDKLVVGGHAVFVIKDMIKSKKVWELHRMLADLLNNNMELQGTLVLPHYPGSLAMNTYEDKYNVRPPMEQIVIIFKKIK